MAMAWVENGRCGNAPVNEGDKMALAETGRKDAAAAGRRQ